MGFLSPKPKAAATVAPLPAAPERSTAETDALAAEQRKMFAGQSGGRASTYLTGSGTSAVSSASRFLGGGA